MNSNHIVFSRKYRPLFFSDIIGQDSTSQILEIGLKNNTLGHAFMFSGIRGTGKTTFARILARSFNCIKLNEVNIEEPEKTTLDCMSCPSCSSFIAGENVDIIEVDAASNTGIDDIRELISTSQYKPFFNFKIFIIDEVHMLSKGAFNALLKTLEEPPSHVKFIFATTELKKVPATVLSRCIVFNLSVINDKDIFVNLQKICDLEKIKYEPEALKVIAKVSSGSARDSLSILEQIAIAGPITTKSVSNSLSLFDVKSMHVLLEGVLNKETTSIIKFFTSFNLDIEYLLVELINATYEYIKYKTINHEVQPIYLNEKIKIALDKTDKKDLFILWEKISAINIQNEVSPKLTLEISLIQYCYIVEYINDEMSQQKNDKINLKDDLELKKGLKDFLSEIE